MINKFSGVVAIVLAVVAMVVAFSADGVQGPQGPAGPVGGSAGPYKTEHQVFGNGFTNGGTVTATTTVDSAITLDSRHLREGVSLMSMNIGVNATVTTMASTSAPLVGLEPGQSFTTYFYNASTTAGSTATFAAGTGVDLQEDEGATVVVNGLELARLTFIKKPDSDVALWVEVGQVGD